jgi:conjugal transfer/entry exclusion protein
MRRLLGYLVVVLVTCAIPASSQIIGPGPLPVTEVGPAGLDAAVTAIQSTISAVEDVIQSAYMLLELTPLDEITIAGDFAETIGLLGELVAEGQELMGDAEAAQAQIEELFDLTSAPDNPTDLTLRVAQIREHIFAARVYAIRVQTLISTIGSAAEHLANLVTLLGELLGNMQGNQITHQLLATANQTLGTAATQAAAMQRVEVMDTLTSSLIVVSLNNIEASRWASWPLP